MTQAAFSGIDLIQLMTQVVFPGFDLIQLFERTQVKRTQVELKRTRCDSELTHGSTLGYMYATNWFDFICTKKLSKAKSFEWRHILLQ